MNWDLVPISIAALAITAVACTFVAYSVARKRGRWINFPSLLLVNYAMSLPISGIVHLSRLSGNSRGYFDALAAPSSSDIGTATLAVAVGALLLIAGTMLGDRSRSTQPTYEGPTSTTGERTTLIAAGALLLPGGLIATAQLSAYAASTDTTRIITLTDGMARVSYFSNWLCWAIAFLTMALLAAKRFERSALGTSFLLAIAILLIVSILSWTGGRSVILVFILPLIACYWHRLRSAAWLLFPLGLISGLLYITGVTIERFSNKSSNVSNIWTWLDWEWGRFSMVVFAVNHSDQYGFLAGETLLQGVSNVALGALRLIGFHVANPPLRSSMEVAGSSLLGTNDIYVVPGMVAELMMNFGIIGVLAGLILLGWSASWVDRRFELASSLSTRLAWAYIGTLLVLRTISADSGTIYSYILFTGLPVLVVSCIVNAGGRIDASLHTGRRLLRMS